MNRLAAVMIVAFILAFGTGVFATSHRSREATAYANFEPCATTDLSSTAPNTTVDIVTTFGVGLDPSTCSPFASPNDNPGQWNVDQLIHFTPLNWVLANDLDIPDGTLVGSTNSKMVFGLFDNGCQTILNVPFDLFEGTTNRFGSTVGARPLGQPDRLAPMSDHDSDGVPDAAPSWPTYLGEVASSFGMDLNYLVARYIGVNNTSIPGTTVVVNFLVFQPGSQVSNTFAIDPALGWPMLMVLQDPSAPTSAQDPTSDICAPLWMQTTLDGSAGGGVPAFRASSAPGIYDFVTFAAPAPDADEDGMENALDPCPLTPNASGWDPRGPLFQNPGDQDGDGLPDDCDPQPGVPSPCNSQTGISNSDEDCDGWMNRLDNCPLVANADQADSDHDAIGSACDPEPTVTNGNHPSVCLVNQVVIGVGGPAPPDPSTLVPCNGVTLPPPTPPPPTPTPGSVGTLAIDTNPIGNTPTSIGPIDGCVSIPAGGSVTVDIVVDSIPSFDGNTGGLAGMGFNILYDQSILNVSSKAPAATTSLLGVKATSSVTSFSENFFPDSDGNYKAVELDSDADYESGAGVLLQLTLSAVGAGLANVSLSDVQSGTTDTGGDGDGIPDIYNSDTSVYTLGTILDAQIAVGQPCPPATPTPSPSPAPTATPTATPTASPTAPPTSTTPPPTATVTPVPTSSATPPPGGDLEVSVRVDGSGRVTPSTGEAEVSGVLSCSVPAEGIVFGELVQRSGRFLIRGSFFAEVACDGDSPWTGVVISENGLFKGGKADVEIQAIAFNDFDFAIVETTAQVQLKGSGKTQTRCPSGGNDGFELGNVDSNVIPCWTVLVQPGSSGDWCNQAADQLPQGPCSGNTTVVAAPPEGSQAAMTNQPGPGSLLLYRCGALRSGEVSFQLFIRNVATVFFSPPDLDYTGEFNQQFRADLVSADAMAADPFTVAPGDVLLNLYQSQPSDPQLSPYTVITGDASAHVGRQVCLRFAVVDNFFYFHAGVDDVKIDLRSKKR